MKRKTLGLLACPTCRGELSLNDQGGSGSIETGTLVCARCQRQCPIKEGIPHFIEPEELTDDRVQEVSFGPGINLPYLFERGFAPLSYRYLPPGTTVVRRLHFRDNGTLNFKRRDNMVTKTQKDIDTLISLK